MKSRFALIIILVVGAVVTLGCSGKIASSKSNQDQAWVQWATESINTLSPDLTSLYLYQPYDVPGYTDAVISEASQLKTDCLNCIQKEKDLTSSRSMKPQFENFKTALSFYYNAADLLSTNSSPIPYSSRCLTASQDFQQATDYINKANLSSFISSN